MRNSIIFALIAVLLSVSARAEPRDQATVTIYPFSASGTYIDHLDNPPRDGRNIRVYGPWLGCGHIVHWGKWDLSVGVVSGWISEKGLLVAELSGWTEPNAPTLCAPVS
jgi:hypothetical protein